jgi:hypothetical protein
MPSVFAITSSGCWSITPTPATRSSRSSSDRAYREFCCASSTPDCADTASACFRNTLLLKPITVSISVIDSTISIMVKPGRARRIGYLTRISGQKGAMTVVLRTFPASCACATCTVMIL